MYKCLRKIGTKGGKTPASSMVRVNEFKEQFEKVRNVRYYEDPSVIVTVISERSERRCDDNDKLNEELEREEIERAMKDMKDSSPGDDRVQLRYICDACEEVRMRVIKIVRIRFEKRASDWDDCAKSGIIVPLFKKSDRNDTNN